jgi:hypothetical protein
MTRDNFDADYLRAEMRAERQERLARERDYRETGYLGDYEPEQHSEALRNALDWAEVASEGDYLLDDEECLPGDMCGLTHEEISVVDDALYRRKLRLTRDSIGLVAKPRVRV